MTQHQYKIGDRVIVSEDAWGLAEDFQGETVTISRLRSAGGYYFNDGQYDIFLEPSEIVGRALTPEPEKEAPPVLKQGRLWQVRDPGAAYKQAIFPLDYDCVAFVEANTPEAAFELLNHPDVTEEELEKRLLRLSARIRSMSSGDVIEIDGVFHYCQVVGWCEIPHFPAKVHPFQGVLP